MRCHLVTAAALLLALAGCASEETAPESGAAVPSYPLVGRGHEPGWLVTIGAEEIDVTANYGERELVAATPEPERIENGWRFAVPSENLAIELHDRPCSDSATGEPYPKTVELTLDGESFQGCGR